MPQRRCSLVLEVKRAGILKGASVFPWFFSHSQHQTGESNIGILIKTYAFHSPCLSSILCVEFSAHGGGGGYWEAAFGNPLWRQPATIVQTVYKNVGMYCRLQLLCDSIRWLYRQSQLPTILQYLGTPELLCTSVHMACPYQQRKTNRRYSSQQGKYCIQDKKIRF